MFILATYLPVAVLIPFKPSDELTLITIGPELTCNISIPHIFKLKFSLYGWKSNSTSNNSSIRVWTEFSFCCLSFPVFVKLVVAITLSPTFLIKSSIFTLVSKTCSWYPNTFSRKCCNQRNWSHERLIATDSLILKNSSFQTIELHSYHKSHWFTYTWDNSTMVKKWFTVISDRRSVTGDIHVAVYGSNYVDVMA